MLLSSQPPDGHPQNCKTNGQQKHEQQLQERGWKEGILQDLLSEGGVLLADLLLQIVWGEGSLFLIHSLYLFVNLPPALWKEYQKTERMQGGRRTHVTTDTHAPSFQTWM